MDEALEILKYILPSLVVFATVYYVMKKYLEHQYSLQALQYKQKQMNNTMPLKLQAYERMAVLCERISIDNLSYRLSNTHMDAKSLGQAMLIAIQQEYEHNLSQQVYTSDKLWEIVTAAKNQMQNIVSTAMADPSIETSPAALVEKAIDIQNQMGGNPVMTAKKAIKKEMQLVF